MPTHERIRHLLIAILSLALLFPAGGSKPPLHLQFTAIGTRHTSWHRGSNATWLNGTIHGRFLVDQERLRVVFPAVASSPDRTTYDAEDLLQASRRLSMPYFDRIACWIFDGHAGMNATALFMTNVATAVGINTLAYADAQAAAGTSHTSDGRPCVMYINTTSTQQHKFCMGTNGGEVLRVEQIATMDGHFSNFTMEFTSLSTDRASLDQSYDALVGATGDCADLRSIPSSSDAEDDDERLGGSWAAAPSPRFAGVDEDEIRNMMSVRLPRLQPELAGDRVGLQAAFWKRQRDWDDQAVRRARGIARVGGSTAPRRATDTKEEEEETEYVPPPSFDARQAWPQCADSIGRIRDQGRCGSCWSHGAVESLQDRTCIAAQGHGSSGTELSVEYVLDCDVSDSGCGGGYLDLVWLFLHHNGTAAEACVPYVSANATPTLSGGPPRRCPHRCSDGSAISTLTRAASAAPVASHPGDVKAMQQAIAESGPIESIIWVFSDFMAYKNGTYEVGAHAKANGPLGGHAIKIVGWGEDRNGTPFWTVANSFGTDWGMGGFFHIRRGTNEAGIETIPTAG